MQEAVLVPKPTDVVQQLLVTEAFYAKRVMEDATEELNAGRDKGRRKKKKRGEKKEYMSVKLSAEGLRFLAGVVVSR